MSIDNKKFGGLSAFSRFLTNLRNLFLDKTGDTLEGNIYITPYYDSTITEPEGGQTLIVSKGKTAKGTYPSEETEWHTLVMAVDNTGSTNNVHKYGQVETSVSTAGTVETKLTAYRNLAGSSAGGTISIRVDPDGTIYATAPTISDLDVFNTGIATTAYINNFSNHYTIPNADILEMFNMADSSEKSY